VDVTMSTDVKIQGSCYGTIARRGSRLLKNRASRGNKSPFSDILFPSNRGRIGWTKGIRRHFQIDYSITIFGLKYRGGSPVVLGGFLLKNNSMCGPPGTIALTQYGIDGWIVAGLKESRTKVQG